MNELDLAAQRMSAGTPADALRFYQLLADATLYLLLEREAEAERIAPLRFDLPDGPVVLAFDSEDRLAGWGQGPQPYAALPGRLVAQQLAGTGISLGLNFGSDAPSEILLPPNSLHWLSDTLARNPDQGTARPLQFLPASAVPQDLQAALERVVASSAGMATAGLLAEAQYDDGRNGLILGILGADPAAHPALARALSEAVIFSGLDAASVDVTFLSNDAPTLASLLRVAHRFAFPAPPEPLAAQPPAAPGSDPDRPPRLR